VTGDNLNDRFAARMGALLGPEFPTDIALAVSGGGDSMAMLALAHDWARHMGVRLWVVTVDHGLRPESGDEAAMVAAECAALGHPHATLRWHWDGQGNLQDSARRARLELIDRWRRGIEHVLMAHTQDDVAETFLMRLARGSGVDGLSAMAARRWVASAGHGADELPVRDVTQAVPPPNRPGPTGETPGRGYYVIRPLLTERREDLRHYVSTLQVPFVDDPSNEDERFERVRARQAMAEIGIDTATLAATAHRLARARPALAARAAGVAQTVVRTGDDGVLRIDRDGFATVERDTQLRLIAAALQWVGGAEYRPRASPLEALLDRALAGGGGTLQGAKVEVTRGQIEVFREFAAICGVAVPTGRDNVWDDRWVIHGAPVAGMTVRALGDDGWAQLSDLAPGAPRHGIARTLPAVFDGDKLIACPALGHGPRVFSELRRSGGHFLALLNPH
jgi:tRNA(Ile)-lysidine synthase